MSNASYRICLVLEKCIETAIGNWCDTQELKTRIFFGVTENKATAEQDFIRGCKKLNSIEFKDLEKENKQLKQSCKAHQEYARQRLDRIHDLEADNKRLNFEIDRLNDTELVSHCRLIIRKNKQLKEELETVNARFRHYARDHGDDFDG